MKYLVYLSAAVELFNEDQLVELLDKSRLNNTERKITGLLLYHDGGFIQVLEGSKTDVDFIFKKIKYDLRHKNVIVIAEGEHDERAFGNWSMGFHKATAEDMAAFEAYTTPENVKDLASSNSDHPALLMLKTFVATNF